MNRAAATASKCRVASSSSSGSCTAAPAGRSGTSQQGPKVTDTTAISAASAPRRSSLHRRDAPACLRFRGTFIEATNRLPGVRLGYVTPIRRRHAGWPVTVQARYRQRASLHRSGKRGFSRNCERRQLSPRGAATALAHCARKTPLTSLTWPSSRLRRAFAAFSPRLSTNTASESCPTAAGVAFEPVRRK